MPTQPARPCCATGGSETGCQVTMWHSPVATGDRLPPHVKSGCAWLGVMASASGENEPSPMKPEGLNSSSTTNGSDRPKLLVVPLMLELPAREPLTVLPVGAPPLPAVPVGLAPPVVAPLTA